MSKMILLPGSAGGGLPAGLIGNNCFAVIWESPAIKQHLPAAQDFGARLRLNSHTYLAGFLQPSTTMGPVLTTTQGGT